MNNNHWPEKNLKELISFLSCQHPGGIRVRAVCEKVGITPQAVSAILHKDDTSLLWVEKLACKYGYKLRLEYTIPKCMQDKGDQDATKQYPNAGNLAGLASYATSRGFTINTVAKHLNMNYRVVGRALKTGNIQLSTFHSILNRLDIEVEWVWDPVSQTHEGA